MRTDLAPVFTVLCVVWLASGCDGSAERSEEPQEPLVAAYNQAAKDRTTEDSIFHGRLRVVHLYRPQLATGFEHRGIPMTEQIPRFVEAVYAPYQSFWNGYLGDQEAFTRWMAEEWQFGSDPRWRVPLMLDFGELIGETAEGMRRLTGRVPEGTWYLVYGPGWTNMGGLGDGVMVLDFYGMATGDPVEEIRFGLPHELNHLIFDATHVEDPDRGTVLERIVSEGFATYVNYLYWKRRFPQARSLGYTDEEWQWAVSNEREIAERASVDLTSRERLVVNRYAARNSTIWPDGPGAIGYFLGFRIVDAYVLRHGEDSWRDLYDLSLSEVLERSGYLKAGPVSPS